MILLAGRAGAVLYGDGEKNHQTKCRAPLRCKISEARAEMHSLQLVTLRVVTGRVVQWHGHVVVRDIMFRCGWAV